MGQVKTKLQRKKKSDILKLTKKKSITINEDRHGVSLKQKNSNLKAQTQHTSNTPFNKKTSDAAVTKSTNLSTSHSFNTKNISQKNTNIGNKKLEISPIRKKKEMGSDMEHELKKDPSVVPFQKIKSYTRSASKKGKSSLSDPLVHKKEQESFRKVEQRNSQSNMPPSFKKLTDDIHFQKKMNENSNRLIAEIKKINSFSKQDSLIEPSQFNKMEPLKTVQKKKQHDTKSLLVKKAYILPSNPQNLQKNKNPQQIDSKENKITEQPPNDTTLTKKDITIKSNETKPSINKIVVPQKKKSIILPKLFLNKKENTSFSSSEPSYVVSEKSNPLKHSNTSIKGQVKHFNKPKKQLESPNPQSASFQKDVMLKRKPTLKPSLTSFSTNTMVSTSPLRDNSKRRDALDNNRCKSISSQNSFVFSKGLSSLRSDSTKSFLTDAGNVKFRNLGVASIEKSFVTDSPTCAVFHMSKEYLTSKSESLELSPTTFKTNGSSTLTKNGAPRKSQKVKKKTKHPKRRSMDESKKKKALSFLERISCSCRLPEHARNKCITCQRITFDDCPLL